jgi:hypothetical protein
MTVWVKETARNAVESLENSAMLIEQIKATNKLLRKDKNNEVRALPYLSEDRGMPQRE